MTTAIHTNTKLGIGNDFFTESDFIYTKYLKQTKILDQSEVKDLIRYYYKTQDKETLELIVGSFQKLIVKVARDSKKKLSFHSKDLDLMDLVQQGNLGLMNALNIHIKDPNIGYDPDRNISPSTYFTTAVSNYINNYAFRKGPVLRMTDQDKAKMTRIGAVYNLSEQNNISLKDALKIYNDNEKRSKKKNKCPLKESDLYDYRPYVIQSIFTPISEEGNELLEVIPDKRNTEEQVIIKETIYKALKERLDDLDFNLVVDMIIEEVKIDHLCKKYKMTKQQIRTRKANIIKKLSKDDYFKDLLVQAASL